jgi:pleiotropic regulator 1
LAVSQDNKIFASGSQDCTTKLFDLASGKLLLTLTGHVEGVRSVVFSASESTRLYTSGEDDVVKIFDLSQNRVVHQFRSHKAGVYAVAENADIQVLATAGRDRIIRLHDLRTKSPVHAFEGHTAAVECLAFGSRGRLFSGSTDTTARVWDVVAGKSLQTLTQHKRAVKFVGERRSDGALVTAGSDAVRLFGGVSQLDHLQVLHRPSMGLRATALAHIGGVLALAGDHGRIELLDVHSGSLVQPALTVPPAPGSGLGEDPALYALAFDRSETRLIAGGADKTVKMFKPAL